MGCGASAPDEPSTEAPVSPTPTQVPAATDASWEQQTLDRVELGSYRFFAGKDGFFADNTAQGLLARFGTDGAALGTKGSPDVTAQLRLASWGRAGREQSLARPTYRIGECARPEQVDAEGKCLEQVEARYAGIVEYWDNQQRGLEHTFRLQQSPSGSGPVQLTLEVQGAKLRSNAGNSVTFELPSGETIAYEELFVTDAQGRALAASMTATGQSIVISVDDREAHYPILVDPVATSVSWQAELADKTVAFGDSVANAGDVNADGYDDIIIGADQYDSGGIQDSGRVFVYYGGSSGLPATASWTFDGTWPSGRFGYAVDAAGDVNGDGYSDIIVGEPQASALIHRGGAAHIFYGSATGLKTSPIWKVDGTFYVGWLGMSVECAGDVNGDGKSDILIAAPNASDPEEREGIVYLYLSSASGLDTTPDWQREPHQVFSWFGMGLAGLGDVNGDGLSDFAIGAPYYGSTDAGRVWGYLGRRNNVPDDSTWRRDGTQDNALFGMHVAPAGDHNGDGYADLLVNSPRYDTATVVDAGALWFYPGAATGFVGGAVLVRNSANYGSWGKGDDTAGDVNGDGYAEFIMGDPNSSAWLQWGGQGMPEANYVAELAASSMRETSSAGDVNGDGYADVMIGDGLNSQVELHRGSQVNLKSSANGKTLTDGVVGNQFGNGFTTCDANLDGYSDLLVGGPFFDDGQPAAGKVYGYDGSAAGIDGGLGFTVTGAANDAHFGSAIACADFDNDGYVDLAVGAPDYDDTGFLNAGRVSIFKGKSDGWFTTPAAAHYTSHSADARYGQALAVGDLNGDGFADLAIGSPDLTNDQSKEGRVWVYYGSATGLPTTANRQLERTYAQAGFGKALAIGDANGDGYDDLVVGSPTYTGGESAEGRIYFYYGSSTGLPVNPSVTAPESDRITAVFGNSLAFSDVNADGYADLMVSASRYENGSAEEGRVFLYLGASTGLSVASWFYESNLQLGRLGQQVSGGDFDHDGYGDFMVSYGGYTQGIKRLGKILVFKGSSNATPLATSPSYENSGNSGFLGYGSDVSMLGDFNGDGSSDLLTTYQSSDIGKVLTYNLDSKNGAALRLLKPGTSAGLHPKAKSPSRAVDVRLFARSAFGRTRAKVQVEVKPRATAFNGQGLVSGTTWTDTGIEGSNATAAVTGLAANTAYHVRARVRYEPTVPIGATHSPWFYAGELGQKNGVHFRTP